MSRMSILSVFALCLCVACSAEPSPDRSVPETSERARDSAVAGSKLPGAAGVRGAMKAADSAEARNARLDSLAAEADP